jgi:hypothetical protein
MTSTTDPNSIYLQTSLYTTLCDALDSLITSRDLSPSICSVIMRHFIPSFQKVFSTHVTARMTLKVRLPPLIQDLTALITNRVDLTTTAIAMRHGCFD